MPAIIRAVFFDAVGTLLFPHPPAIEAYGEAARQRGVMISPELIRQRFHKSYRQQELLDRASGWATSEERERSRWQAIVAATLKEVPDTEACFRELFDHFARPSAWRLHAEAAPLLERMHQSGLIVGMGTNYDARVWSVIAGFPALAALKDRVVVSAAVGFRKPAPEFFREVVRSAGCEPGEVLFVGDDRENDYDGARSAGLQAFLIPREPHPADSLDPPLLKWLTSGRYPGLP